MWLSDTLLPWQFSRKQYPQGTCSGIIYSGHREVGISVSRLTFPKWSMSSCVTVSLPAELPSPNTQRAELQCWLQRGAAWKCFFLTSDAMGGERRGPESLTFTAAGSVAACRHYGPYLKISVVGSHLTSCLLKHVTSELKRTAGHSGHQTGEFISNSQSHLMSSSMKTTAMFAEQIIYNWVILSNFQCCTQHTINSCLEVWVYQFFLLRSW